MSTPAASNSTIHNMADNPADAEMIEAMFADCGYNAQELNASLDAERDVLGSRHPPEAPPQPVVVVERARQGFREAVASLLPERRQAYDHARKQSPRTVELESPPERFLKACEYNFWTAAERMADYWTERKRIFGPDQYHLPLRLSSGRDGNHHPTALAAPARTMLQKGAARLLPPDQFDRPILFVDRDLVTKEWHGNIRLQVFFYLLQAISESENGTNGWVGLLANHTTTSNSSTQEEDTSNNQEQDKTAPDGSPMKLVQSEVIPVKIKALHILAWKKSSFPQRCVNLWLSFVQTWNFLNFRVRVHHATCPEQIVNELQEFGMSRVHLPERFGGGGTAQGVVASDWYQQRLVMEQERYQFLENPEKPSTKDTEDSSSKCAEAKSAAKEEEMLKRRLDALKDWSESFADDRQLAQLEAEVASLTTQQAQLEKDEKYLQVLERLGTFVAQEYEQERTQIRNQLTTAFHAIVAHTPGILPEYRENPHLAGSLAEWFLTHWLVYAGRDSSTGERLFWQKPQQNNDTEPLLLRVREDQDIPGMADFLQRLQLSLQGQGALLGEAPTEEVPTVNNEAAAVNDKVADPQESSSSEQRNRRQEKQRQDDRAKRIKLLKRL